MRLTTRLLLASLLGLAGSSPALGQGTLTLLGSHCTPALEDPVTEAGTGRTYVQVAAIRIHRLR